MQYLGLGLMWSWIYCLWFSPAIFLPGEGEGRGITWLVSLAASAVVLFILAVLRGREKLLPSIWLYLAPIGVSLSTFVLLFVPTGLISWISTMIGGALTAFLWVQWGELYCSLDEEVMEACVPSSAVIVMGAALLAIGLPSSVSGVFVALIPLISGILMLVCHGEEGLLIPSFELANSKKGLRSLLVKLGLVSMICSMASGFIVALTENPASFLFGSLVILAVVIGAFFAILLSLGLIFFARRIDFACLYQWVFPILVLAICLFIAGGLNAATASLVLSFCVAFSVDCVFMIIAARLTKKGFCAPAEAFGVFRGFVQMGCLIAALIAGTVINLQIDPLLPLLVFIFACVIALIAVVYLQEDLKDLVVAPESASALLPAADEEIMKKMAEQFKLSPREVEVLSLLSRGRSVPYMRDVLVISKSTIETHIKHLYAKIDVHSKQELINLFESYRSIK
jgi:DNA-binding CsgD family transcriptional regulator